MIQKEQEADTLNSIIVELKRIIIGVIIAILLLVIEIEMIPMIGLMLFSEVVKNMKKDIDEENIKI
jgi:hypothetical protein